MIDNDYIYQWVMQKNYFNNQKVSAVFIPAYACLGRGANNINLWNIHAKRSALGARHLPSLDVWGAGTHVIGFRLVYFTVRKTDCGWHSHRTTDKTNVIDVLFT